MYTLLQVLSIMVLGFFLARAGSWSKEFFQQLSRFVVRVALPIHFFVKLSQTNPDNIRQSLLFPFLALIVIGTNFLWSLFIFRFLPGSFSLKRIGIALSTFANTGIIPLTLVELFPLTIPMLGEQFGTTAPSLYVGTYLLVSSPSLWSLGNFLMVGKGRLPRLKELITPPLIGIVAGLLVVFFRLQPILLDEHWPIYHIFKSFERFGAITFSLVLLCLGSMIARINLGEENRRIVFAYTIAVSAIRFLFMPGLFLLAYSLILRRLSLSPAQYWVIFLEMHLPPALNLPIMAAQAGMNENQASFIIMVTYLIYMLVLPVYLLVFLALMGVS